MSRVLIGDTKWKHLIFGERSVSFFSFFLSKIYIFFSSSNYWPQKFPFFVCPSVKIGLVSERLRTNKEVMLLESSRHTCKKDTQSKWGNIVKRSKNNTVNLFCISHEISISDPRLKITHSLYTMLRQFISYVKNCSRKRKCDGNGTG